MLSPLGVPIQKETPGQTKASPTPWLSAAIQEYGGLGPGWNRTQEKFFSPYFTHWCNLRDCFGNHRLCKFPGIKQKEQLTKERRKSPTDKRPISFLNCPLWCVRKNNLLSPETFKLGIEDASISTPPNFRAQFGRENPSVYSGGVISLLFSVT